MAKENNATETNNNSENTDNKPRYGVKGGARAPGAGGPKSDQATVDERVHVIYKMRSRGHDRQSCMRFATGSDGWGVSLRTFESYWAKCTELMRETWSVDRQEIFFDCLAGLREAQQMACEQRNPSASQACISSIAKLCAVDPSVPWSRLYEPKKNGS